MILTKLTREDFENLPFYTGSSEEVIKEFSCIVIAPAGDLHDSGFGNIRIFGLDENYVPRYELTRYSDAIHFNGIGGYGNVPLPEYHERITTRKGPIIDWKIDLLPCGYFRIFKQGNIKLGSTFSDFEILD